MVPSKASSAIAPSSPSTSCIHAESSARTSRFRTSSSPSLMTESSFAVSPPKRVKASSVVVAGSKVTGFESVTSANVSRSVFDLDTFADVTLSKPVTFEPATTTEDALTRLGGDTAKLLSVINEGLLEVRKREVRADDSAWMQEVEGEDGAIALEAFDGTIADQKMVNNLVLNIAK